MMTAHRDRQWHRATPPGVLRAMDAGPGGLAIKGTSRLSAMAGALLGLAACSGGLGAGQIRHAVQAKLASEGMLDVCFTPDQPRSATWPLRVERGMGLLRPAPMDPVLADMGRAGYLAVDQERSAGFPPALFDVITPTERAKGWWDPKRGWCVGRLAIERVLKWTEPGKDEGSPVTATFTWKLTDVPSWAARREFADIPGMTPRNGTAHLQKTSAGWEATEVDLQGDGS